MCTTDVRGKDMKFDIVLPVSDIAERYAAYRVAEQTGTELSS